MKAREAASGSEQEERRLEPAGEEVGCAARRGGSRRSSRGSRPRRWSSPRAEVKGVGKDPFAFSPVAASARGRRTRSCPGRSPGEGTLRVERLVERHRADRPRRAVVVDEAARAPAARRPSSPSRRPRAPGRADPPAPARRRGSRHRDRWGGSPPPAWPPPPRAAGSARPSASRGTGDPPSPSGSRRGRRCPPPPAPPPGRGRPPGWSRRRRGRRRRRRRLPGPSACGSAARTPAVEPSSSLGRLSSRTDASSMATTQTRSGRAAYRAPGTAGRVRAVPDRRRWASARAQRPPPADQRQQECGPVTLPARAPNT